jgi:hypothetical protein
MESYSPTLPTLSQYSPKHFWEGNYSYIYTWEYLSPSMYICNRGESNKKPKPIFGAKANDPRLRLLTHPDPPPPARHCAEAASA